MFLREAGKDSVVIVRDRSPKNLPRNAKGPCSALPVFLCDLESRWRSVCVSLHPSDERHSPEIWNNLLQEFHLFGEQAEPGNSSDVSSGPCETGYETLPHRLPCIKHDNR